MKTTSASTWIKWAIGLMLIMAATGVRAAQPVGFVAMNVGLYDFRNVRFEFKRPELAGFEIDRLNDRLQIIQVRGWRMASNAWFGQTRVGHHSGLGFVVQNGETIYQLDNRGIQVTRYF